MSDPVHDLYQSRVYPALSHPSTDPSVTVVAAKLAGLEVPDPSAARVLEIGCAAGHNLLPLAARWPAGHFTGIDFSKPAIDEARETARLAGLENVEFIETDLRTFEPGEKAGYDFIIAHGVYSWVGDDVRQALLDFCTVNLSVCGVALISYNTLPGWSLRKSLVGLTNLLSGRTAAESIGRDSAQILGFLATAAGNHNAYARHLTAVLHDMFGKGDDVWAFDDFSPINGPCTFLDFTGHASRSGLRYLGESELAKNFPASLAPEASGVLTPLADDPLALQQTIDVLTNRTFRSSLLCRADAPARNRTSTAAVLQFAVRSPYDFALVAGGVGVLSRAGEELARFGHPLAVAFFSVLAESRLESVSIHEVVERMSVVLKGPMDPAQGLPFLARLVMDSARQGLVFLRNEPVRFGSGPPAFPDLGTLGLLAVRKEQPIVDRYHTPCCLDVAERQVGLAMDGSRSVAELAALAGTIAPKLDFHAWLGKLAARGVFVG